jgi:integrase
MFALLACTGLRVSEAIHLRFEDITPDGLVIRCSKFRNYAASLTMLDLDGAIANSKGMNEKLSA